MMDGLGIHVCVTGATGYLAGHIVKQLLERQYTVHATCRDPNNMKAVQHLLTLPNAAQLLKLYQADLLCPGSFGEAITGCKYVIHTASPYMVDCSRVKVRGSPAKHVMPVSADSRLAGTCPEDRDKNNPCSEHHAIWLSIKHHMVTT
jgi:putative NADH-flavin reductase